MKVIRLESVNSTNAYAKEIANACGSLATITEELTDAIKNTEVGTGKTKELMEAALEADGTIFTNNKRALRVKADAYGFDTLNIIDWDDLFAGDYDPDKPIFVHKLEDIMEELFYSDYGLRLMGYSVALGG